MCVCIVDNKIYKSLEAFRSFAAVFVVLYHSTFINGSKGQIIGNAAIFVDFFFILSGFVMTYAYKDKIMNRMPIKKYLIMRVARLYPLHLFTLFLWIPFVIFKAFMFYYYSIGSNDPLLSHTPWNFLLNIFLLNAFFSIDQVAWNYPSWSISTEFYTYLIFFLIVRYFNKIKNITSVLLISLSFYTLLYLFSDSSLLAEYQLSIFRCVGGFFLGSYIYSMGKLLKINLNEIQSTILEILSILLMIYFYLNSNNSKNYQLLTFMSFAFIIFIFTIQSNGVISRWLSGNLMQRFGSLSYSIYMNHALILVIFGSIWKYFLKFPYEPLIMYGNSETIFINTPYAIYVNLFSLFVILILSYFTYTYIEMPGKRYFAKKLRS